MGLLTDSQLRHSTIKGEPLILCHPNIPKSLHGVNPRTHMGTKWWDVERKKAYSLKDHHCYACGQHMKASIRPYLEAHEEYMYDYETGEVRLTRIVALCHECHSFIHSGLLAKKAQKGEITFEFHDMIVDRGCQILEDADLLDEWESRHNFIIDHLDWNDWHMIMPDGKTVHPDLKSIEEWEKFYGK